MPSCCRTARRHGAPGFASSTRLGQHPQGSRAPFQYSATATCVPEFGHQTLRFFVSGAAVLEANQTIGSIAGSTINLTSRLHRRRLGLRRQPLLEGGHRRRERFTVTDLWGTAVTPTGTTVARVCDRHALQ